MVEILCQFPMPLQVVNELGTTINEIKDRYTILLHKVNEEVIGNVGFCKHTISTTKYRAVGSVRTVYEYIGNNTWRITTQDISEVYRKDELISISVLPIIFLSAAIYIPSLTFYVFV